MASLFSMRSATEIIRGIASTLLFVVFGIGALAISPVVALMPRPEWAQRVIRFTWRPLVLLFVALRLIRIERGNLHPVKGAVIAANHPSFIDVVLLTVLMPRTIAVAKHALKYNPFMAIIVRKATLPDDARLIGSAGDLLRRGWNVLIFPEGTRSPAGGMHPFHRGAVQLALRANAPLVAVGIAQSERILGKGQKPWQLGARPVTYRFRMDKPRLLAAERWAGTPCQREVRRLNAELERRIRALVTSIVRPVLSTQVESPSHSPLSLVAAVIPVYNPEPDLKPICEKLVECFGQVIVVDDGSVSDRERFDELPPKVKVLHHTVNRGKGRAMKTAIAALSPEIAAVVFADGDGQHLVHDIERVARRAVDDDIVVFGVRNFRGKDVPFRSWWGNRWTALEVRLLFGLAIGDTQTGLRAIPSRLIVDIARIGGERYEFEARHFKFLSRRNEPIGQVPIATVYRDSNRKSHFRPFLDTLRTQAALFFLICVAISKPPLVGLAPRASRAVTVAFYHNSPLCGGRVATALPLGNDSREVLKLPPLAHTPCESEVSYL